MTSKVLTSLIFCSFVATGASAQISGGGTPGYIPEFNGTQLLGNSNIFQTPNGDVAIGTTTPSDKFVVFDTDEVNAAGIQPVAVYGIVNSTRPFTSGIRGDSGSGAGFGVVGVNYQNDAAASGQNSGGGGVIGYITGTVGFLSAVYGTAKGTSGPTVAVFGEQYSPGGQAGLFINRAGGTILQGAAGQNPGVTVFRVDGSGTVFANGGFRPHGADFAESMRVKGNADKYAAGDVLVIDPTASQRVALARRPYSTLVAGIYSTKPGLLGSNRKVDEAAPQNEVPLAVVGIVPCKVTAENGPIRIGDLLVSSSTPGHAMKGTERSKLVGAVVGKALEPLDRDKGVIQVLVTLQ